jgi:hypothetical protein
MMPEPCADEARGIIMADDALARLSLSKRLGITFS